MLQQLQMVSFSGLGIYTFEQWKEQMAVLELIAMWFVASAVVGLLLGLALHRLTGE